MFAEGRVLSTTGLETYAACPFRYLLRNVLGKAPGRAGGAVAHAAQRSGALMHTVLERFIASLPDGRLDPDAVPRCTVGGYPRAERCRPRRG